MTKKDYKMMADMFLDMKWDEEEWLKAWRSFVWQAAFVFSRDNPKFNRDKFFKACEYEE